MPELFETGKSAVFSPGKFYRYSLKREWGKGSKVTFVMLNPSTADDHCDDPTTRRCLGWAYDEGFDRYEAVNLFAWRSPSPAALTQPKDPIGPENDAHILRATAEADCIVAAWGAIDKRWLGRAHAVTELLVDVARKHFRSLGCLGFTKYGYPAHPLYLPGPWKVQRFPRRRRSG